MQAAKKLHSYGIISDGQLNTIETHEANKLFSVHWELRSTLYLGIFLLTSGIGILVYQHIDSIGHQAILLLIALVCTACFYYSFRNRIAYSNSENSHPSPFFDYIILLGCLLFGILIAYVQFQYSLFGFHYGLATLLPTLIFFFCAYFFDHKGILSLGITGLAAWAGLSVTPLELLERNDFSDIEIITTSLILGIAITSFAWYADKANIKKHFSFSYNNFGANILFIATLAALFDQDLKLISFILLVALFVYFGKYAIAQQSLWFLLISVVYGYIGLSYAFFNLLIEFSGLDELIVLISSLYGIASCVSIVLFFINYKKLLQIKS